MNLFPILFQSLFTLTQYSESLKFWGALPHVQQIQERLLFNYLRRNQTTIFGNEHRFSNLLTIDDYREQVPIRTYQQFLPYIEQIQQGESHVLTTEPVRYFLPTGGTSGTKLIPYTALLKQEFQRTLAPWLVDIVRSFPRILGGKTYWSVTPPGHRLTTLNAREIPIGFEDDSAYFGWKGALLGNIFAVPGWITQLQSMENFRFLTLYFLLRESNLRWISIWSPTFLLVLLQELERHAERLSASLHDGYPHLPENETLPATLPKRPFPDRAKLLSNVLRSPDGPRYARLWPHLSFLSLWQDAYACHPAQQLQQLFPRTYFQGKGLLATEGVMTIPLHAAGGSIPALTSHFLEFIDSRQQPCCMWKLEDGETYSIVLTTGGGLYRYAIGDLVQVTGFYKSLPVLKFLGREGRFSDLVGEKLDEQFVTAALEANLEHSPIKYSFVLIAPEIWPDSRGYVLFVETSVPATYLRTLARDLEEALQQNIHYKYAVDLGQLQPLRVCQVTKNGQKIYLQRCVDDGQQLGDIKPLVFDTRTGWTRYFSGT